MPRSLFSSLSDDGNKQRGLFSLRTAKFLTAIYVALFSLGLGAITTWAGVTKGLVGYWNFDESVGSVVKDLSGNNNTGILINGASWQVGKFGYALSLNGQEQYVEIPHADSLITPKEFSISAWFNNRALSDGRLSDPEFHIIASKGWAPDAGGSWTLAWDKKSNDISFCVRKGTDKGYACVFADSQVGDNEWHHIAGVVYNGKLSLYMDGSLAAKPVALGTDGMFNNREDVRIGAVSPEPNKFLQGWDGLIDEVQLFNRALSESEIKAMVQDITSSQSSQTTTTESGTATVTSASATSGSSKWTVDTPVISPNGGTTANAVSVTLKTATPGANIYFTTDGTTPTQASNLYKAPFTVATTTLVKAKGFKNNSNPSSEASAWFTIDNQQFDFSLANSGNKSAQKGASAQNQISAALLSGTTQPVAFSVSGMPAGANGSFSSSSCGPACSTTLTVTTSASTPAGTFPLVVTGDSGGKSKSTSFNLTVTDVPFDFSLSNLGNQSVTAGSPASNKIDATLASGSSQSVTFSASGLPAGATASFSAASCTPTCSSTLTINTTAGTTPAGTSTITVLASGGGVTRSTTFSLTVSVPTVATPTITPNGGSFNGSVSITMATATSGASIRYTTDGSTPTASSTLFNSAFNLANSATIKAAAFMTNYNPSGVASAAFTITQPFDFSVSASNNGSSTVTAGSSIGFLATATLLSGNSQAVTFSASGLPSGASASFSSASCSPTCSSTLTINTMAGTTPAGTSTITVSASGAGVTRTTTFSLTVSAPTVATPTITPNGGSFTGPVSITMATATAGASIRYTTDGSAPTTTSTLYSGAFTISNSATVKAAAFKTNYNTSAVASAPFTIATSCPAGQFLAEYFNNTTLSGAPTYTNCTPSINYNWGTGGPGNGIGTDAFSVRWTASFSFSAGNYVFTATADDGIRVWVDGTQIINQWKDQAATTYQATVSLTAGTHAIKVEYYENGGGAVAQVGWQSGPTPSQLTVTWQDMSTNEDGFAVERKLGTSGTYTQIATLGNNLTSYQDTGIASGSQYCYRVKAFNATQSSAYSNEACQTAP